VGCPIATAGCKTSLSIDGGRGHLKGWETRAYKRSTRSHKTVLEGNALGLEAKFSKHAVVHSSRSNTKGSIDSARRAGIHVATSPSSDMATTTPANTSGSRGVA